MKLKCNYCGSFIKDTDEKCPNCGAVNEHLMRSADGIPILYIRILSEENTGTHAL